MKAAEHVEMDTLHAGLLYKTLRRFHVFVRNNHLIFEIDLLVVKLLWMKIYVFEKF